MERGEVSALVSPSRRRSKLRAQRGGGDTGFDEEASKREEIVVEDLEDEALLRALDEQLQQRIERLTDVDLVLGAKQINYLAFRLHEALEPKPDPETNVIQAWTIQPQAQLKIKMSSHIQVLKLSTILREVRRLRIHQQSQLRSPIEIEIFPSLRAIEILHTDVVALRNVHFFARQLRQFRLEHTPLSSLSQVLSPHECEPTTWTRLKSLRMNCCSLPAIDSSINQLSVVEVVDLAWNEIARFDQPAQCTTLRWLDLCHNKLTAFPQLSNLLMLKVLDLSANHVTSLKGVEALTALIDLDVSHNALSKIGEMELLTGLKELRRLVIRENPIARRPDYRREVLFYLGEQVEVDDEDWTQVELLSMKNSRRLRRREEAPSSTNSNAVMSWTPAPFVAKSAWDSTNATMVYPALAPICAGISAQQVDIAPPPRLYSPRRRNNGEQLQSSGPSKSSRILKTSGLLNRTGARGSVEGTVTDATDDADESALPSEPHVVSVNDFFRLRSASAATTPAKQKELNIGVPVDASIEYESDSDDSSSEKGRNRSRKYTESDFMRDFEEEETLLQEGAVDAFGTRARRQSSINQKSARHQNVSSSVNVRVLLSAEDAAVFDLAFGIDGLVATVEVKANEILETLHVPERDSSIAFSRRLPDVVAVGVSTHSTRGKIVVLKLRKSDHAVGGVTYQIETIATLVRLLAPLLGHLYAAVPALQLPTAFVCSNCSGVSHLTSEYIGASRPKSVAGDALVLQACLLCTSLNVRELSSDRLLAMYAAEGMAALAKRIKPASERRAQVEVGFTVEEQEMNEQDELDIQYCVMISANGIREAVNAAVATA